MHLVSLTTCQFRNLHPAPLSWSPTTNLILGCNGHGKTNLLEAITVLGNLRSFRTNSWRPVVRHQRDFLIVRGDVVRHDRHLSLMVRVRLGSPPERSVWINGRSTSVDVYLPQFPVFVLSGLDRDLISGSPAVRRAFLDRFAFHLTADVLSLIRTFQRTLRQRNAALGRQVSDIELDAWDSRLATSASRLITRREEALDVLTPNFTEIYSRLSTASSPRVEIRPSWSFLVPTAGGPLGLEETLRERYNSTRARDRQAGHTLEGPHRHDVILLADGKPARDVLSSGQTKVVAAALRLATVVSVEQTRGGRYPLVIDDVDSEIDRGVLGRITRWLGADRQTFLSSATMDGLAEQIGTPRVLRVVDGHCNALHPQAGESA